MTKADLSFSGSDKPVPAFMMNEAQMHTFFEGLERVDHVAFDTESNGLDIRTEAGRVIGFSVSFRPYEGIDPFAAYIPVSHIDYNYSEGTWRKILEAVLQKTLIMHNAKHDLKAIEKLGYYFDGPYYDTMLMAHMLDENLPSKSLDYVAQRYTGERKERSEAMQMTIDAFGWGMLPAEMTAEYAQHDAYITLLVFEKLKPKFDKEVEPACWEFEQEFSRVLAEIEATGVRIDPDFIRHEIERGAALMDDIAYSIGLNPGSTKDLNELLIERLNLPVVKNTPAGRPSFDKKTMEEYDILLENLGSPLARDILTYRGWQKTVSSTYRPLLELVSADGRVRPNFKIHGTRTGRLSCERPNLQQIPRTSVYDWNGGSKRAFVAEPGWELWDFDYRNLEFRLAAAAADERELLDIFNTGRDVFSEMAASLSMKRQDVKTLVYTIMFGGGRKRIATVFNVSPDRADEILEGFYERYPSLRETAKKAQSYARKHGRIPIWTGRYRHFDDPRNQAHKAFNSLIQGGAADLVKRQLVRVANILDPSEARIVLTVHDSLVIEIERPHVETYVPEIVKTMEAVHPDFGVKFEVEAKRWGE